MLKTHEAADYAEANTSNWMSLKRENVPLMNVFGEALFFFFFLSFLEHNPFFQNHPLLKLPTTLDMILEQTENSSKKELASQKVLWQGFQMSKEKVQWY